MPELRRIIWIYQGFKGEEEKKCENCLISFQI